jgi:hypothetical protein
MRPKNYHSCSWPSSIGSHVSYGVPLSASTVQAYFLAGMVVRHRDYHNSEYIQFWLNRKLYWVQRMKNRLLNILSRRTSSEIPAKDASITESESSTPGWNKINWKGVSANYGQRDREALTEVDIRQAICAAAQFLYHLRSWRKLHGM